MRVNIVNDGRVIFFLGELRFMMSVHSHLLTVIYFIIRVLLMKKGEVDISII